MNIGKAIKTMRIVRKMSQSDLAEKSEISVSYLSLLERSKRDPTLSTLENIAKSLGISLVVLMFLASSEDDLNFADIETREKIAYRIMKIIKSDNDE